MKATVFGASGFIGTHLMRHLASIGIAAEAVARGDESWQSRDLGHAFYCIGLTADFRKRPLDTIDAHVVRLNEVLRHGRFDSLLYLSSTRVYLGAENTREDAVLRVDPNRPDDLYNLSKLLGEAACLAQSNPAVRVARLSNVYGAGMGATNFLGSLIENALHDRQISLATAGASEKDYVSIGDAVRGLTDIALRGVHRLYNVASGHNTMHKEVADCLASLTGCSVAIAADAPAVKFPPIDVSRLRSVSVSESSNVIADLDVLIADARGARTRKT